LKSDTTNTAPSQVDTKQPGLAPVDKVDAKQPAPVQVGTGQPAPSQAKNRMLAGQPFLVLLDGLSDHIGTIKPGAQYEVQFVPGNRAWRATGPVYPQGHQSHEDPAHLVCEPEKGGFCIWGVAFRSDQRGQVFFVAGGEPALEQRLRDKRVGRIRALKVDISAGMPFSVLLDGLSEHIGTIKPQGRYELQFLPKNMMWRASGPVHPEGHQSHDDSAYSVCEPAKNGLCIWGVAFRFDERGQVFFVAGGEPALEERLRGRRVGRII
jgi:hypothetical protein